MYEDDCIDVYWDDLNEMSAREAWEDEMADRYGTQMDDDGSYDDDGGDDY